MSTTCPQCGLIQADTNPACSWCGTTFAVETPTSVQPTVVVPRTVEQDWTPIPPAPIPQPVVPPAPITAETHVLAGPPSQRRRAPAVTWVFAGIATLAVAGLLASLLIGGDDDPASAPPPPTATPTTAVAATPAPTVAPTTSLLATTLPPTTIVETTVPPPPTTLPDPFGIGVSISAPPCDGSYVTFVGASVTPERYATELSTYLRTFPGSNYLLTRGSCSSLRQQSPQATDIYSVYYGPFATAAEACAARANGPAGSYVKRLDNESDPFTAVDC